MILTGNALLILSSHSSTRFLFSSTVQYYMEHYIPTRCSHSLGPPINVEYKKSNLTEILTDGIILEKNLILLKNLNGLDRNELGGKEPVFIDVWPVSILDSDQILTDGHFDFDESSLFLLQLGKYQKISRKSLSSHVIIFVSSCI